MLAAGEWEEAVDSLISFACGFFVMGVNVWIEVGRSDAILRDAWRLRNIVFTEEQGIDGDLDRDGLDAECTHALAYLEGQAIGVGRMDAAGKIGRVATLSAYRSKGYGRLIMAELEKAAVAAGHTETVLYAQESALPFYLKIGYEEVGPRFMEAGIRHQKMRKLLGFSPD